MKVGEAVETFNQYLRQKKLKTTRQRSLITEIFFDPQHSSEHPTVEELYIRVKEKDTSVGHATIYRTLKLLVEADLAIPNRIGESLTRYEPEMGNHHDHMMCRQCGLIIEFKDKEIERLQIKVAKRMGFILFDHSMNLIVEPKTPCIYGECVN
jgi:Fur family transcriptional regulator, ferric uptake regulator